MIHIVWGTGDGPTRTAAFDDALAAAGVHDYNLRTLSSVLPPNVSVERSDTAPDLGERGNALDVVMATHVGPPGERAAAGLAWVRGDDGSGIFYEEGDTHPETVRERLQAGIEHGCSLRDIDPGGVEMEVRSVDAAVDWYVCAVVLATYGKSKPLL